MQEREIFDAALSLPDADAQADYVRRACGNDPAMREHLLGLLQAQRKLGSFLEAGPAAGKHTQVHTSQIHHPGDLIAGRYKLLEQIGEGGMGAVWMAEQKEPVKRKVAVKLVKAGMDSAQVLARFEAERQALALMDHPNIAKVFDGGMTDQGRPFFVMEFVKGVPLTEYCNEARLSLKERLNLFIPVCQAVQHAHQKGIIHRDLKPSNILVCLYDGNPVPKVIDFGLAKAMHQSLSEHTIHTAFGMMVGTPLYMSPEQAEHNNLDVDTRTDIYSLGVILYELLTGTTPLEQKQLKEAAYNEILRLIKEVEPPKPSTRLSGSASLPSIAAQRSIEPQQLSKSLSGDLDWIVMKALDKERSRRYETANGLARDVERFLSDEAVEASPPSASYRFRKLARRNKRVIITGVLVAAMLVIGLAGTAWQAIRARNAERIATQSARMALTNAQHANEQRLKAFAERDAKVQALAEEEKQRQRADRERARADEEAQIAEAVNSFLINDILRANPYSGLTGMSAGAAPTILQVVERSASQVGNRFKNQPLVEASVRSAIGCSLLEFQKLEEAREQLEISVRLFRNAKGDDDDEHSIRAMQLLAYVLMSLGRLEESEKLHSDVLQRAERKLPVTLETRRVAMSHYAHCLTALGKYKLAEPLYQQCIADTLKYAGETSQLQMVRDGLAGLYVGQGRIDEAEQLYRQALLEHRRLESDFHPNTVLLIERLGDVLMQQQRFREALSLLEAAVSAEQNNFGSQRASILLPLLTKLEAVNLHLDRTDRAELVVKQAIELMEKDGVSDHLLAGGVGNSLVRAYESNGKHAQAVEIRTAILNAQQKVMKPDDPRIALSLAMLGKSLLSDGKPDEAESRFRESLKVNNNKGVIRPDQMHTMIDLGTACRLQGKHQQAIEIYENVRSLQMKEFGADHPATLSTTWFLAVAIDSAGKLAEAIEIYQQAARGFEHRKFQDAGAEDAVHSLISAYERSSANEQAVTWRKKLLAFLKTKSGPESVDYVREVALLGFSLLQQKKWADAEPILRECLAIRAKTQPNDWSTFNSRSLLGGCLAGQMKFEEAESLLLEGYNGMKLRESQIPEPAKLRLPEAVDRIIEFYVAAAKQEEASKWRSERAKYP